MLRRSPRLLRQLFHFHNVDAWPVAMKNAIAAECGVREDFVSEEEEGRLLSEVEARLRRLPYESAHWDNAIHLYREREQRMWNEENERVIKRIRDVSFPKNTSHLTYVHILDLHKDGYIKPHIDSVRYCGDVITGVSLLSSCIMRLRHEKRPDKLFVDLLLPRRSLYRLGGIGRYEFMHEVLEEEKSLFEGEQIPRDRRISIICRDLPKEQAKIFSKMQPIPEE